MRTFYVCGIVAVVVVVVVVVVWISTGIIGYDRPNLVKFMLAQIMKSWLRHRSGQSGND